MKLMNVFAWIEFMADKDVVHTNYVELIFTLIIALGFAIALVVVFFRNLFK